MNPIDISGKKFNKFTVISYDRNSCKTGHAKWICICDCGEKRSVRASHLKSGQSRCCGCIGRSKSSLFLKKYANSDLHKGPGNPQWKGKKAGYNSIHAWLRRNFIKEKCEECEIKKNLDFALKKGKIHSHNRDNYIILCRSHHIFYDRI